MQYGDLNQNADKISLYLGVDPANANISFPVNNDFLAEIGLYSGVQSINQRDADMIHLWTKVTDYKRRIMCGS